MNASKSYESVRENRYFSKRGTITIEGSIVISEQPTLTEEQNTHMFAVKNKDGMYLDGDDGWCMCYDLDNIKWFKFYLEAEEFATKRDLRVVSCLDITKEALALKDTKIRQLTDDNVRLNEAYNNWKETTHSLDSLHGIQPEHANETHHLEYRSKA